jgi:hypothetical protein
METLAEAVQDATKESIEPAYVDRVYAGEVLAEEQVRDIQLDVAKYLGAKKGFVLLPRWWEWSAASRGLRASGGWSKTTSGCPR